MSNLTVRQIADRFSKTQKTVNDWINAGHFPNAKKVTHPVFGEYWEVPESDIKDFVPPPSGRPKKNKENLAA